jgi:hypothetical protein
MMSKVRAIHVWKGRLGCEPGKKRDEVDSKVYTSRRERCKDNSESDIGAELYISMYARAGFCGRSPVRHAQDLNSNNESN